MRPAAALVCALLVAAPVSCGRPQAPVATAGLALRVEGPEEPVTPGRAFPLRVVSVFERDRPPEPPAGLPPLTLRLRETERRSAAGIVEETRHYDAWLFALSDVVLPPLEIRAADAAGGPPRVAASEPLRIAVVPDVDPARPGEPELAELLSRDGAGWGRAVALALLATLALAALAARQLRHRRLAAAPAALAPASDAPAAPPRPSPCAVALARLQHLQARPVDDAASDVAFHVELAEVLRALLADACSVRTRERTTDEIVASLTAGAAAGQRRPVHDVLAACDLAKFAGQRTSPDRRAAALATARGVVLSLDGTAPPDARTPPAARAPEHGRR